MQAHRFGRAANRLLVFVLYLFLLAPVFPVIMMSFTNDTFVMFPPESWGVRWYFAIWHNTAFQDALWVSVFVGMVTTAVAILVGVPAAYAIVRLPLPGRQFLLGLFTAPLIVPTIILGLGLLLVLVRIEMRGTYLGLIVAHSVLVVPYMIRIVATGLTTLPSDVEAAAATLGAPPLKVFRHVTMPLLSPAILGAAGLCFLVSFDEVAVSLFIVGTKISTLPVTIFRYTQDHTDPQIAVVSVLLILISALFIIALERTVGLMRAIGQ